MTTGTLTYIFTDVIVDTPDSTFTITGPWIVSLPLTYTTNTTVISGFNKFPEAVFMVKIPDLDSYGHILKSDVRDKEVSRRLLDYSYH